jgi:hypothetical protein
MFVSIVGEHKLSLKGGLIKKFSRLVEVVQLWFQCDICVDLEIVDASLMKDQLAIVNRRGRY